MHEVVIKISVSIILLRCQSDKSIVVQEDLHRTNGGSYQHINSKVVFMASIKCRFLYILLDYVLNLVLVDLSRHQRFLLLLRLWITIKLSSLNALFHFEKLIKILFVKLLLFIKRYAKVFYLRHDEYAASLRT